MTVLLPSRTLIRRTIAALWVLACLWLLARTLLLRHAPPDLFADAEEYEQILLLALSTPLCLVGVTVAQRITFNWWPYPANDARTIVVIWLAFFLVGCLQWFVLVPWVVHKWYDVYDSIAVRRQSRQ